MKDENTEKKKILIVEDQFVEAYDLQLILENAGYLVTGIAHSAQKAREMIALQKPDLVCLDIFLQGKETGIDLAGKLREDNIGFIYISANSGRDILSQAKETQPYGFIVKPFREQDVLTTLEIACYRHRHNVEFVFRQVVMLQKNIEAITFMQVKWEQALCHFGKMLQPYIPFDYLDSGRSEMTGEKYDIIGLLCKNFEEYQLISPQRYAEITAMELSHLARQKANRPKPESPILYDHQSFTRICMESPAIRQVAETFGARSLMAVPVRPGNGESFLFCFYSRQNGVYSNEHLFLMSGLEPVLVKLLRKMYGSEPVNKASQWESPEIPHGNDPVPFQGMIGNSKKMASVFNYIKKVAPTDTAVLILGESGTGKEKVAQSIHDLSPRKDHPFIVINCGAIPEKLAESILFGHEKGAFTGALDRQIGKFELADKGTIFLDEIGEMPIDLQVKLLRVLQEMEIERVGGRAPVKINTRIIAATNKNLEEAVAAGKFRMDLYYRLYIFPITVPPLRDRKDDIPALASHFVEIYARKMGRGTLSLSESLVNRLIDYPWPGNIRQLEHLVQRSILLTEGKTIREMDFPASQSYQPENQDAFAVKTIHENERDYIYAILKQCKGKVYGVGGAAEMLDIPPSTLNSKIKKLGIKLKMF